MLKTPGNYITQALLIIVLAGCVAPPLAAPTATAPPAAASANPIALMITDGTAEQTLRPGVAAFDPIAAALADLVAGIDNKARTYFPEERFRDEVSRLPRLEADYGGDVTLTGKGYQVQANRLVIVIASGEQLILARPAAEPTWGVYLTSDAARFDRLVKAIKEQTGVDLQAAP